MGFFMKIISAVSISFLVFVIISCNNIEKNPLSSSTFDISKNISEKSDVALSDDMHVAPFKIILNSRGTDYVIRTIHSGSMPSGYRIYSYDLSLYFNDVKVVDANSFRYCYTDYNYIAEFPRNSIVNNNYVRSLAGSTVTVYMKGSYVLINNDNSTISREVDRTGTVEIVQP
jgi:hypothetical protein